MANRQAQVRRTGSENLKSCNACISKYIQLHFSCVLKYRRSETYVKITVEKN